MSKTRTITAAALLATAAVGVAVAVGPGVASSAPAASPGRADDGVKAATAKYHDVDQAVRDGYSGIGLDGAPEPCVSSPDGVMGIHYVNGGLIAEEGIDPLRPEILLYIPGKNGKLVLVGVEYFAVDADQNVATDDDRPSALGRPLEGPMTHEPDSLPVHYDLHRWIWSDNPSGEYAMFNPALSCG